MAPLSISLISLVSTKFTVSYEVCTQNVAEDISFIDSKLQRFYKLQSLYICSVDTLSLLVV